MKLFVKFENIDIMKHGVNLLIIIFVAFFYSCNNESVIQYKWHMSHDKTYEVEVPIDFDSEKSIGDLLIFTQEETHSFITIQVLKDGESLSYFAENYNTGGDFDYSLVQQTDSTRYYKVTRGISMWCAYKLYMIKKVENNQYIICIFSDILGKDRMVTILEHIQRSLTGLSQKTEIIEGDKDVNNDKNCTFTTRNTNYYSIDYPKDWKIVMNPEQMTDVYIGDSQGNLGFTILFFDTDYTLSDINEESNANMKNAGAKLISNRKMDINEQSCYYSVYEFSLGDKNIKQISYTFKNNNTMFNVKFGNLKEEVDKNITLIENIISTFLIK